MRHTICSTLLYLPELAPAPPSWQFDIVSAVIGAVVALVLVGLIYRSRESLRQGREAIVTRLAQLSQSLQASVEDRYRELVAARARSLIMPAIVPLDDVFVEPELSIPLPIPQTIAELDTLPTVPQILPLHQTLGEHPQLAILGATGTGKTTLLAYVALACARPGNNAAIRVTLGAVQERLPIYVLLPAMDWDESDKNGNTDNESKKAKQESNATDKLIHAALAAVEGNRGMIKLLREHLRTGQAIVLVDGWAELLPPQRQRATEWLSELINTVPGNLWLVSAELQGYAPLTEAGFVPLKLAAWQTGRVESFARQCLTAYTPAGTDEKQVAAALSQLIATLRQAARAGATPLELSLRTWVYLLDGQTPVQRMELFAHALSLLLRPQKGKKVEEQPWLLPTCQKVLEQIALDIQQNERPTVSREEIDAAIESALPPPEERPARAAPHIFRTLTNEQGLLRSVSPDRYTFSHSLWQAYLVAHQLPVVDPANLVEQLDDPRWSEILRFYAEIGDMKPLIAAWLRRPDDAFRTRLRTLSTWVNVAPQSADWRDGTMAVLARGFLQSKHPPLVSQRLAEALAATGIPGVTYVFKQALQHPDAGMRKAAVVGLTQARTVGESDLPALEAVLEDQVPAVREAVVRGLAHVGTDAATRWLAHMLLEGDETLSIVAAKALAKCGEEGINFLHKAIEAEDTIARRAAVYGLAQIGDQGLLEKVAREDEQWIVRSAATMALDELNAREKILGVSPPPDVAQLPWLISWAATKGEGVGLGDAAQSMLARALDEGDATTRLLAARVLAQVGRSDDVEMLRKALANSAPDVTNAVWGALAEISERYASSIT
jgi:hypothetical protein